MRTSYKQLALEYLDRFCAAVSDYKRENELRLFYEKENKQLKEKLKTVTDAADSTMCHMQYYEKQCKELEKELEQAKKVQVVEHFEAYGQCRDSRRIASLEKENAELKVYNEKLLNSDIEKHNKIVELKDKLNNLSKVAEVRLANWQKYEEENIKLKAQIEKMKADYDKLLDEKIELEDRLAESRECY